MLSFQLILFALNSFVLFLKLKMNQIPSSQIFLFELRLNIVYCLTSASYPNEYIWQMRIFVVGQLRLHFEHSLFGRLDQTDHVQIVPHLAQSLFNSLEAI